MLIYFFRATLCAIYVLQKTFAAAKVLIFFEIRKKMEEKILATEVTSAGQNHPKQQSLDR